MLFRSLRLQVLDRWRIVHGTSHGFDLAGFDIERALIGLHIISLTVSGVADKGAGWNRCIACFGVIGWFDVGHLSLNGINGE